MEYSYTDTDDTPLAMRLTLADIRRLRRVFEHVTNDESAESLVRYAAQDFDAALVKALAKAADAFANEADAMRRRAASGN